MDKNMIHIDDLVKQRLSGGEEQERPGAWLHMRDLLDEKMPVKAPAVFAWRRMLTLTAALLALSAIGIGTYSALHSARNGGSKDIAATSPASPAQQAGTAANNTGAGKAEGNTLTTNDKGELTGNSGNTTANNNMNTGNDNIPGTATAAVAPVRKAAAANEEHNSGHKNISSNKLNNNNLKINTESVAKGNAISSNTTGSTANTAAAGNKHTATANKKVNAKIVPAAGNNVVKDMAVATTVKPKDISKGAAHDSIPSISLKEKLVVDPRAGKAHYERDTVGTGMAVLPVTAPVQRPANSIPSAENNYNNPRYVASAAENPNVQTEPTEPQILPAAAMKTTATASKETGLVAAHKARRSHEGWNFAAVSQFLQDAKHSLGQIQTSTGLILGINTVFLTGGMVPGIQLGATETLGISDRIAVMLELKYHQSFNRGITINDNYVRYVEQADHSYLRDSMELNYNFSTLQQFTLPVTVQYKINDLFTVFAGGSMVYTLGITPENPETPLYDYRQTGLANPGEAVLNASKPKVTTSDFGSRFGLGYIFGASYQVAPKISVDARMTQTFWDNAATPGAKIVSDRLYKKPGVQLSIGYNLSKERKN